MNKKCCDTMLAIVFSKLISSNILRKDDDGSFSAIVKHKRQDFGFSLGWWIGEFGFKSR